MLQTNLTTNAKSNTFVNMMRTESSIVSHMELSLFKSTSDNRTLKKTVLIFAGYEYTVSFFDMVSNKKQTITGLVESINGTNSNASAQYITLKYIVNSTPVTDSDVSVIRGPGCGCILNKPDDSKYNTTATVDIPISNIIDVVYISGGTNPVPPTKPKKGVMVVLLGISAEICRAVVINLRLIEDGCDCDTAVRDVNLKVGGIYTIAYISTKDKAMYEFDGKLVAIQETNKAPSKNTIVRGCENVGLKDSIYRAECDCMSNKNDKDDYLVSNNIKEDILLTFDTSTDFTGEYQSVMLSWIRDCRVIEESCEDTSNENINDNCCDACAAKKPIEMKAGCTSIKLNPITQEVEYTTDIVTDKISLQEIMDFYFACGC